MNQTKPQKSFNVVLILLSAWWAISVVMRGYLYQLLQNEPDTDQFMFIALGVAMVIEAISALLGVITVVARFRGASFAPTLTLATNIAFLFHPLFGTLLGLFGLLVVRKHDKEGELGQEAG